MTAPLCGRVSMPPLAMDATRCSTSGGMPAAWAFCRNVSAIAASAMLRPPDADPVMPASEVTVMASLISGWGMALSAPATTRKPGSAAMTAPKPYSEAVLADASSAPAMADFDPSANLAATGFQPKTSTVKMPARSAPSTAQMAATLEISCVTGAAWPTTAGMNEWASPYSLGMATVNT